MSTTLTVYIQDVQLPRLVTLIEGAGFTVNSSTVLAAPLTCEVVVNENLNNPQKTTVEGLVLDLITGVIWS